MDITNMKIKKAIRINHPDYFDFFNAKEFSKPEEALNTVRNGRYATICHYYSKEDAHIYDIISKGKSFPLQDLEYDALIESEDQYYLIKLEC